MPHHSRPHALPRGRGSRVQAAGAAPPTGPGNAPRAPHEVQVRCPQEAGPPLFTRTARAGLRGVVYEMGAKRGLGTGPGATPEFYHTGAQRGCVSEVQADTPGCGGTWEAVSGSPPGPRGQLGRRVWGGEAGLALWRPDQSLRRMRWGVSAWRPLDSARQEEQGRPLCR